MHKMQMKIYSYVSITYVLVLKLSNNSFIYAGNIIVYDNDNFYIVYVIDNFTIIKN